MISLPEPALVVLIGAAGSGKSTLAARTFPPEWILSSDAHRALVSGNEADQTATRTAFSVLHRRLVKRLAARQTTVVDATNVTPFARRSLVRRAAAQGIPAVAVVLDLEPRLVLARNAMRVGARIVPVSAVERQLADLERSLRRGSLDQEGFAAVHVLRTPVDVDAFGIAAPGGLPVSPPPRR